MASSAPFKSQSQSQPLHNFGLPRLKWKTEGSSSAHNRRRTIKSPLRPNPSPSPIRNSRRPDSVSETPPQRRSPARRELPDWAGKQSLTRPDSSIHKPPVVHGESFSSKPPAVPEFVKRSPVGGDLVQNSDSESGEVSQRSLDRPIIEYHRIYKNVSSNDVKIGGVKVEKKHNAAAEGDGIKKSMNKLLIKIPIKNNKQEEENPKKNPVKIESNGKEPVKIESKNKDVVSKGKEGVNIESKNKDVVSKGKEPVKIESKKSESKGLRIESKNKDVVSKGKERVKIESKKSESKGKEPVKIESKDKDVESKGKEPVKIETKKKGVQGKDKELVKMDKNVESKDGEQVEKEEKVPNNDSFDEEMKSWNLRPRKPINKCQNTNKGGNALKASGSNGSTSAKPEKGKTQSPTSNVKDNSGEKEKKASGNGGGGGGVKKEKQKLTIHPSLTRREIEEDFYAFTSAKSSRRPKKRAKNVQNLLDNLYPGQNLVGISAESYYVSANSMK